MVKAPEVEHLLEDVKRGDKPAFETLVQTLTQALFHYAGSIVRDSGAAEEIVQNTFIRVFKKRGGLDTAGSLRGYCYRIATNLAYNHLRDRQLRREREQESVSMREQTATDPQTAALAREAWQMVEDLPDEMRVVMHLRYGQGLTLAETSVALEIPEGTVSTRQRNGLQKLRERLALSLPVAPALDELGTSLGSVQPVSVAASPGLVSRVETIVMASIGTKSVSNVLILVIVGVLLLGGGAAVAAISMGQQDSPTPNTIGLEPTEESGGTADAEEPLIQPNEPDKEGGESEGVEEESKPPAQIEETEQPDVVEYQATVRGRVVDSAGNPIPGARVEPGELTVFESASNRLLADGKPLPKPEGVCTTDPRGEFELTMEGLHPEGADRAWFALVPKMEGMVGLRTRMMWVAPGGELGDLTLTLYQPGRVEGTVVSELDRETPVSEIKLSITRTTRVGDEQTGILSGWPTATSDAEGRFAFENLPPGSYTVSLFAEDTISQLTPVSQRSSVNLDEAQTYSHILIPYSGATLSFRTDPPLDTVWVDLEIEFKSESYSARTSHYLPVTRDDDGAFRVHGIYPAIKRIVLKPDGFEEVARDAEIRSDEDLDLGTFELSRGHAVSGIVVDAEGNPLHGATVNFYTEPGIQRAHPRTDAQGRFHHGGLEPGDYELKTRLSGYVTQSSRVTVPERGEAPEIRIVLDQGGVVSGTVTVGGKAPTARQLGATGQDGIMMSAAPVSEDGEPDFDRVETWWVPGPEGAFSSHAIQPGRYVVSASYGSMQGVSEPVEVRAGAEATAHVDVPLGAVVTGVITGRDGNPADGMKVYLTTDVFSTFWKWDAPRVKTDAQGRYRFEFIAPGSYYIRLESDPDMMGSEQLGERAVNVDDDTQVNLDIDLSKVKGPMIRGKVTVNGFGTFKEVVLVKPNAAMSFRTGTIDEEGNFEVSGMKPGKYYLWFADSKWTPRVFARRSVEIDEGEIIEINRDFKGCRLNGRVVVANPPEDFDYSSVKVQIKTNAEDDIGADTVKSLAGFDTSCDEDGNYSWSPLVEGPYRIIVNAPGLPAVERTVDLRTDSVLDLVVGGRAGELAVKVTEIEGQETAGELTGTSPVSRMVMMRVFNAEGNEIALTDNQQFFDLEVGEDVAVLSLLPGTYRVEIQGAFIETYRNDVDVRKDETTELDVVLVRAGEIRLKILNDELTAEQVQSAQIQVYDANGELVPLGRDVTALLGMDSDAAARKVLNVNPLTAGSYRVVVQLDGYAEFELTVQVERSTVVEREVTLAR